MIEYLEKEWPENVKDEFINKLDKSIDQIRKYPESSEESKIKKSVRKFVVTKQTTIFYSFDSNTIKALTLFDNRMDPEKLSKEI